MVRNRVEALAVAMADTTNVPGYCQAQTREWLDAPSAGDFDGDGAADAEDGWKREPESARRYSREPLLGTPVSWLGGPNDNGHRALSAGPIGGVYHVRSTDAGGTGRVATVPLSWVERNWGLAYAGWSKTINGYPIPEPPDTTPEKEKPLTRVEKARKHLVLARESALKRGKRTRAKMIITALRALPKR